LGFAEAAPYDAIVVTAAAPHVPESLRRQLAMNGRMVIPVTVGHNQDLLLVERLPDAPPDRGADQAPEEAPEPCFRETSILGCTFVPLIGQDGYQE
jgi:protein-L-isoaspartate(D-aspartate) O-methyltransferase